MKKVKGDHGLCYCFCHFMWSIVALEFVVVVVVVTTKLLPHGIHFNLLCFFDTLQAFKC